MTNLKAQSGEELVAHLLALEVQLMQPVFRRERERVGALLAEEFREFGSSGRVWNRETILDLLVEEADYIAPAIEDVAATMLSPETALLTYRAVRPHLSTLRSSIWILREGRWRVLFHQGTLCAQS
jgi:hypothetical protein